MRQVLATLLMPALISACGRDQDTAFDAASIDADGNHDTGHQVVLDGGKLFMCGTCLCDGLAAYCSKFHGGPPVDGGWLDAPDGDICDGGSASGSCLPYPPSCNDAPACPCLKAGGAPSATCFEREGGVGFEVRLGQ